MRAVIQRVSEASALAGARELGKIGRGFLVLIGIAEGDTEQDARFMADRILGLRVFADSSGKMNLDIRQVGGELLIVSQFTLMADTNSGRRPSFTHAAAPEQAKTLYEKFVSMCGESGVKVGVGEFGAMMVVSLVNDGPVTIILDSRDRG